MAGWFGRFSPRQETRDDDYLVNPLLAGLSVKIRGQASLDVKVYQGVAGTLEIGGRGVGVIGSWLKLSFPLEGTAAWLPGVSPMDWRRIHKRRRISSLAAGEPRPPGETCLVELTEVETLGEPWWTLALEAGGRDPLTAIRHTATTVFAEPPPIRALGADELTSYAEWIRCIHHPARDPAARLG